MKISYWHPARIRAGLEVDVEFNVMSDYSEFTEHLSSWQLVSGDYQVSFPGTAQSVFWSPNDSISMNINWASQSPYRGFALDGKNTAADVLSYKIDGVWGLLTFLNSYKANEIDNESLVAESRLLKFEASVSSRDGQHATPLPNVMRAFARVTLYGIDTETKQKVALVVPEQFPEFAPQVQDGVKK